MEGFCHVKGKDTAHRRKCGKIQRQKALPAARSIFPDQDLGRNVQNHTQVADHFQGQFALAVYLFRRPELASYEPYFSVLQLDLKSDFSLQSRKNTQDSVNSNIRCVVF